MVNYIILQQDNQLIYIKKLKKCIRIINTVQDEPEKAGRWDIIQNEYEDFKFEIIAKDINDFKEREKIEMIYATKFNCLYWQPSITQINSIYISNNSNS